MVVLASPKQPTAAMVSRIDEAIARIREDDSDFLTPDTLVIRTGCTLEQAKERLALVYVHLLAGGHEDVPLRSRPAGALCGATHRHGLQTTPLASVATCPECLKRRFTRSTEVPEEAKVRFLNEWNRAGGTIEEMVLRGLQAAAPSLRAQGAAEAERELSLLREIVGGNGDKLAELSKDRSELVTDLMHVIDERDQALKQGAEEAKREIEALDEARFEAEQREEKLHDRALAAEKERDQALAKGAKEERERLKEVVERACNLRPPTGSGWTEMDSARVEAGSLIAERFLAALDDQEPS